MTTPAPWHIYRTAFASEEERVHFRDHEWLGEGKAPPWRQPRAPATIERKPPDWDPKEKRGACYVDIGGKHGFDLINTALILRRPILLSGPAGIGKSSLAYSIAWRLGLGPPLRWEIGSRTVLQDGLYNYDAVGHLQAIRSVEVVRTDKGKIELPKPGTFITLGPLGTSLLPTKLPRVLLIDELDKASYDLPNDLLHVFEEARFLIPELVRVGGEQDIYPFDRQDRNDKVAVQNGEVRAHHHPVVVITTNNEREFADAFLRRCVRITWRIEDAQDALGDIVRGWFQADADRAIAHLDSLQAANLNLKVERPDLVLQAVGLLQQGVDMKALKHILEGLQRVDRQ